MQAAAPAPVAQAPDSSPVSAHRLWTVEEVLALYEMPFMDLVWRAQQVHRQHFDANAIQRSTLLSVKTGGCSEDCSYCSQSARYDTDVERERLMPIEDVVAAAKVAQEKGASRFCMGAAWRGPKDNDLDKVLEMVREVKALGMQTCVTLGMLKEGQAEKLKEAGLDYYNHNLDTDKEFYGQVIRTHTHDDRLDTLEQVRSAGISVCSGGIVGMGESRRNRAAMLVQLANLPQPPESVPINNLVPIPGTPLGELPPLDPFEFVRTIAAARITMPASYVRLSAGRQDMSDELQALCFLAGANSMFYGDKLLTTGLPDVSRDEVLFERLGLRAV
ncbi:biotin synthase BioB [Azovibrio restrictus]|uniref:biotin synthase BioB n=1 Tax=Azovibrio restrictus TaxID=146938 RepID=UPI000400701E|nr:biotin synthase BioB [Azovibrio restrictus]MCE1170763.1 biotin synthase BioB [Azovibrio sp.]MDD3482269.1 biotin synthase BioB [Azovibrio restrictus]